MERPPQDTRIVELDFAANGPRGFLQRREQIARKGFPLGFTATPNH